MDNTREATDEWQLTIRRSIIHDIKKGRQPNITYLKRPTKKEREQTYTRDKEDRNRKNITDIREEKKRKSGTTNISRTNTDPETDEDRNERENNNTKRKSIENTKTY